MVGTQVLCPPYGKISRREKIGLDVGPRDAIAAVVLGDIQRLVGHPHELRQVDFAAR